MDSLAPQLTKHILTEDEYTANEEKARAAITKKKKTIGTIATAIIVITTAFILFFGLKSGDFSFEVYF